MKRKKKSKKNSSGSNLGWKGIDTRQKFPMNGSQEKRAPIQKLDPKKLRLRKYGSMYHFDVSGIGDDEFKRGSQVLQMHLLELYMKRIPNFEEDTDRILAPKVEEFNGEITINLLKRILRKSNNHSVAMRVQTPSYTFWAFITSPDQQDETTISMVFVDEKVHSVKASMVIANLKRRILSDGSYGSFVFAEKEYVVKNIFKEIRDRNYTLFTTMFTTNKSPVITEDDYLVDYTVLITLTDILGKYGLKIEEIPYKDTWKPSYRDTEIDLFRSITKFATDSRLIKSTNVSSWVNNEHDQSMFTRLAYRKMPDVILNPIDEMDPLLDLTDYEMNFINKYIQKMGLNNTEIDPPVTIDLVYYLSHPRWGKTLRYEVPDETGKKKYMCVTSYELFPDKDYFRFYIVHHPTPEITVFILADFDDIRNFNLLNSLAGISCDVLQKDGSNLVRTWDELVGYIPDFMRTLEGALGIFLDLLYTHIIIQDRPQRMRMIRYTPRPHHSAPHYQEDPPFIVRRILKPLRDVKRILREQKEEGEGRHMEYTAEEWDRVGHWRRLPNSEQMIWIEPTKCHRHLPLSDKEIHIKL